MIFVQGVRERLWTIIVTQCCDIPAPTPWRVRPSKLWSTTNSCIPEKWLCALPLNRVTSSTVRARKPYS